MTKRTRTKYHDSRGLVHHADTSKHDTLTSENSPMFTGIECQLYSECKELDEEMSKEYLIEVMPEFYNSAGYWVSSAGSENNRFSRDNFSGLISIIKLCSKFKSNKVAVKRLKKLVPLFHRQLAHPRDFVLVGFFKYPWLFWPLLPITWVAFLISCLQKYKVRDGNKIVKTDGKLIAFMVCHAFNFRVTYWLCRKAIRVPGFSSRFAVSATYFKDMGHIINEKYASLE